MICTAAGAVVSSALRLRCKQLRTMLSLTGEISAKIRYRAVPLPELIEELSCESVYSDFGFLKRVNGYLNGGMTVQEAWVNAAKTAPFYSDGDREIIADMGNRLGDTDTAGQLSMLALAGDMLSRSLDEAEIDCTKRAKAIISVWTLCGIGAGIIII